MLRDVRDVQDETRYRKIPKGALFFSFFLLFSQERYASCEWECIFSVPFPIPIRTELSMVKSRSVVRKPSAVDPESRVLATGRDRSASGVRALGSGLPASRGDCRETAGQYRRGARPVATARFNPYNPVSRIALMHIRICRNAWTRARNFFEDRHSPIHPYPALISGEFSIVFKYAHFRWSEDALPI